MSATLEELERRVDVLEQSRPADLRRLAETTFKLLEDTRERLSRVEIRLEGVSTALAILTANQAEMRAEIKAGFARVDADIAGLRRDLPGIVADAMREVLRGSKG